MSADSKQQAAPAGERFFALDGWRAISILSVLASHMLPLGPSVLRLNEMAGQLGMAVFFTLSGFLITQQLHAKRHIASFFARRLFRIVPLAWAFTLIATLLVGATAEQGAVHALFLANYLTDPAMQEVAGHYWSLCVEVHFYVAIGLFMAITRFRGFRALPVIWLALVVGRLLTQPQGSIETHARVDEILAGACLALVHLGTFGERPRQLLMRVPPIVFAIVLLIACHPSTAYFGALRSAAAAALVGHTLFASASGSYRFLGHRTLRYIAETSYAIYVIHPLTYYGWLGEGDFVARYAKRVASFALTFSLAHLSTFYFEHPLTELGRKIAKRLEGAPRARG